LWRGSKVVGRGSRKSSVSSLRGPECDQEKRSAPGTEGRHGKARLDENPLSKDRPKPPPSGTVF